MLRGAAAPMEADLRCMRTAGRGPRRYRRAVRRGGGRLSFLSGAGNGGEGKKRVRAAAVVTGRERGRRRRTGPARGPAPHGAPGLRRPPVSAWSRAEGRGGAARGPRARRQRRRRSSCRAGQPLPSVFAQRFVCSPRASPFSFFYDYYFFRMSFLFLTS